jgi:hypothetical protein
MFVFVVRPPCQAALSGRWICATCNGRLHAELHAGILFPRHHGDDCLIGIMGMNETSMIAGAQA